MKTQTVLLVACAIFSTTLAVIFYLKLGQKPLLVSTHALPSVDKNGRSVPSPYERNEVKNAIVKNSHQVQACYNALLERKPRMNKGSVKLDWKISPEGKALGPEVVQSQFHDPEFEKCLTQKIETWTFPPPPTKEAFYVAHLFRFKKNVTGQ